MALHLQKLSVGSESLKSLQAWQSRQAQLRMQKGLSAHNQHVTRMFPKRKDALLDGGSIYWVIKGLIQCRNRLVDLQETQTEDGRKACAIIMDPVLIPVIPTPKRPFQGWRYLTDSDAPRDLIGAGESGELPSDLRLRLINLGVW